MQAWRVHPLYRLADPAMAARMKEADFIGILSKYDEYRSKDPSRAAVALSYLSNQLIGDGKKDFENAFPEIFDQSPD